MNGKELQWNHAFYQLLAVGETEPFECGHITGLSASTCSLVTESEGMRIRFGYKEGCSLAAINRPTPSEKAICIHKLNFDRFPYIRPNKQAPGTSPGALAHYQECHFIRLEDFFNGEFLHSLGKKLSSNQWLRADQMIPFPYPLLSLLGKQTDERTTKNEKSPFRECARLLPSLRHGRLSP